MKGRIWGLPVVLAWDADEPQPAAPVVATIVHVVHHYLPIPAANPRGTEMFSKKKAADYFISAAADVATGEKSFSQVDAETQSLVRQGEMTVPQAEEAMREAKRRFLR